MRQWFGANAMRRNDKGLVTGVRVVNATARSNVRRPILRANACVRLNNVAARGRRLGFYLKVNVSWSRLRAVWFFFMMIR